MKRGWVWLGLWSGVALACVLCFLGQGKAAPPLAPSPFGNTAVLQDEMIVQLKEINAQLKDLNAYLRSGNVRVTLLLPEKNAPAAQEKTQGK